MTPSEPTSFRLDVPDDVLDDLKQRLARTRWPDEVPGSGWAYGSDLAFMKRLVDHWRSGFDWRAQEAKLNAFDQYRVELDDIDLHFIHQRGTGPDPMPLLLVHGWPGSVWEFNELIPLLQKDFTVVAPSLPGYALSFTPNQKRLGPNGMADLFAKLMTDVLGYDRFAAQGGDWGGFVVGRLAHTHGRNLIGAHLNFIPLPPKLDFPDDPSEDELRFAKESRNWNKEEAGYGRIQGTRPQTLSYGLTDSPTGLAAWITEKFHVWTDNDNENDGDLPQTITMDSLLTNVMLYWVTGAINSSFWPYYAVRHGDEPIPSSKAETPTAYADFPSEIHRPPRSFAERVFNIQRWTEMPRGGHFAALEAPDLLAADVAEFFSALR